MKIINIEKIAEEIENELNNAMPSKYSNIMFKLHSAIGWTTPPVREGNTVRQYIDCSVVNVNKAPSNNKDNTGAISFAIEFLIPAERPKTEAGEKIDTGIDDYGGFVDDINSVIEEYFSTARTIKAKNGEDEEIYSFIANKTLTRTGIQQIANLGYGSFSSVEIVGSYAVNGITGGLTHLYVDGEEVSITILSPTGDTTEESGVYDDMITKSFATSSTFAFELNVPCLNDIISGAMERAIFERIVNEVHFFTIEWGNKTYHYLMILKTPHSTTQSILTVGLNCKCIEAVDNIDFLNLPSNFGAKATQYTTSEERNITATTDKDCFINIAGKTTFLKVGEEMKATIKENHYTVDENENYEVYAIYSDNTANITITES